MDTIHREVKYVINALEYVLSNMYHIYKRMCIGALWRIWTYVASRPFQSEQTSQEARSASTGHSRSREPLLWNTGGCSCVLNMLLKDTGYICVKDINVPRITCRFNSAHIVIHHIMHVFYEANVTMILTCVVGGWWDFRYTCRGQNGHWPDRPSVYNDP